MDSDDEDDCDSMPSRASCIDSESDDDGDDDSVICEPCLDAMEPRLELEVGNDADSQAINSETVNE